MSAKTIISYNLNGIRSAMSKGLLEWVKEEDPDIICLQELKAHPDQLDLKLFSDLGYMQYWYPAEKKGYSGVAILSKEQPDHVEYGCGMENYDREGRVIRADYGDISVMSVYHPSGSSGEERQAFKMKWLDDFQAYMDGVKTHRPKIVVSGDYNICHKPIDIHNPKGNAKSSGFLPEERAWLESYVQSGFVDSFREIHQEPHRYSWWSFRSNARAKNLGWRIDYNMVSEKLAGAILDADIFEEIKHSDHCPVKLKINF